MVNRDKRNTAAVLIGRFLAGEITNDDFDASFPDDKRDPALRAIYGRLWFHFDDRRTHWLSGPHAPNERTRALFERCVAFLRSDLEYEWPARLFAAPLALVLTRALGLRNATARRERQADAHLRRFGELDTWPFVSERDLRRVKGDAS